MPVAASARRRSPLNYWPGFVDALSTLLLSIVFLLSIFMLGQFFLAREISGRDTVLDRLNRQIAELTDLLALERSNRRQLESNLAGLQSTLATTEQERGRLQSALDAGSGTAARADAANTALDAEKAATSRALTQVDLLTQQINAMRRQLAALEDALAASESRDRESQARIADLGRRLNVALAQRVQELARYRSEFFGRLRQILSQRSDIRVVGDRFVFQSEVLFPKGSAEINPAGRPELDKLALAMKQLETEIPQDLAWVLRVDGHTDTDPIQTSAFSSNWELSAARAIAVVKELIAQGVSPNRLVAAGFGEFQPIEQGDSEEIKTRNRRIELKL